MKRNAKLSLRLASALGLSAPLLLGCVSSSQQGASATEDASASNGTSGDLIVAIEVSEQRGVVMVALFDSAAAYDGDGGPVRAGRIEIEGPSTAFRIEGLPTGSYAIRAYQDLNSDGKLNTNPFGLPTEPFAFSNAARARYGPPSFSVASFSISAGVTTQTLRFGE